MPKRKIVIIFIGTFLITACVLIALINNFSISANFADNVLRPVIGGKNTVFLESIFFNTQDFFNQLTYKFIRSKDQYSTSDNIIVSNEGVNLTPISPNPALPKIAHEGEWQAVRLSLFPNEVVLAKTFFRPDPKRPYAVVSLVQINMGKVHLSTVAGTKEPGGAAHKGPGMIPQDIKNSNQLIAAFNGGFQQRDGQYGMIVGNETYLPLKKGLATLVIDKDYHLKIVDYEGQDLGTDNVAIRQNGAMLVQDSKVIPSITDNQYSLWGRTVTNSMYTWRSGIGLSKDGNLIYAVGSSLVPETLGKALLAAGAVNAMQLDINPYWVRITLFTPQGYGQYKHSSLLKNMYDGGEQFLNGYQKDFFYLYKNPGS